MLALKQCRDFSDRLSESGRSPPPIRTGGTRIVGCLRPVFAGIIRAVYPAVRTFRLKRCAKRRVKPARIAGSDRDIDLRQVVRQALGQWPPRRPAIGRFEQASAAAVEFVVVLPRTFARFPHRGIHDIGVRRDRSPHQSRRCSHPSKSPAASFGRRRWSDRCRVLRWDRKGGRARQRTLDLGREDQRPARESDSRR